MQAASSTTVNKEPGEGPVTGDGGVVLNKPIVQMKSAAEAGRRACPSETVGFSRAPAQTVPPDFLPGRD